MLSHCIAHPLLALGEVHVHRHLLPDVSLLASDRPVDDVVRGVVGPALPEEFELSHIPAVHVEVEVHAHRAHVVQLRRCDSATTAMVRWCLSGVDMKQLRSCDCKLEVGPKHGGRLALNKVGDCPIDLTCRGLIRNSNHKSANVVIINFITTYCG